MATLLLRLAAPLQAWGIDSKFDTRKTGRVPSKSGVIGLLAAALGYKRYETDKLASLNDLSFGVRTDREGKLLRDFHMAHSIEKDKNNEYKYQCLTQRYYLSDAVFLAGFEGGREKLEEIASALSSPVFPLFLGRRSCPPTLPLCLGVRDLPLEEALRAEPPLVENPRGSMRITTDASENERGIAAQRDIPLSFDPRRRAYGYRNVSEREPILIGKVEHDPFDELEEDNVSLTDKT